ncbi:hypothetical protein ACB377_07780 [Klebsiella michiganensis]
MSIIQKKQSKDAWFKSVMHNAIFFLENSVKNLDTSPKGSIIDFYTAIELIFKARLMIEHWSLILTKPEDAKIANFENGNFHSVYLEQAEKRLRNICNENFKKEAMDNFKSLGEHRNQIVHFAHTGFNEKNDTLVIEHWTSWFYLRDLIKNQWSEVFKDYQDRFDSIHIQIQNRREFLQVKFDAIYDTIENEKKSGKEVSTCPSCQFKSAIIIKNNYWGKDFECRVCEVKDDIPTPITRAIDCEHCNTPLAYFLLDTPSCKNCNNEVTQKYALEKYTAYYRKDYEEDEYSDIDESYPIAFCHHCESDIPSVIEIDGLEVCVFCETRGWRIMYCDHCNNYVTGDSDKIKHFACHLCEDDARKAFEEEMAEYSYSQ